MGEEFGCDDGDSGSLVGISHANRNLTRTGTVKGIRSVQPNSPVKLLNACIQGFETFLYSGFWELDS